MGRKSEYRAAARLLWAAGRVVEDSRILTRFTDEAARERFEALDQDIRTLASDLYGDRTYKKDSND